mmetsp:Transcript_3351/g.12739  ORF Transcript_3351/g.12739 Transcript_3351/m.12739 type:complete len:92 (+) Transcript_3351:1175-1450(+)
MRILFLSRGQVLVSLEELFADLGREEIRQQYQQPYALHPPLFPDRANTLALSHVKFAAHRTERHHHHHHRKRKQATSVMKKSLRIQKFCEL